MIQFDPKTRAQLYQALKSSFPDTRIGKGDLLALALCLQSGKAADGTNLPNELQAIDLTPYAAALDTARAALPNLDQTVVTRSASDTRRYYWIEATHARLTPSGFDSFTGELAMARVKLPRQTPARFTTAIGTVDPSDHLIDTVFEANQKFARHLGYELERVDCITPPRQSLRFAAISVMLGYRLATDPLPSCYILEAGTATGQPKVLYLGKTIGSTINAYSGYQPTPFSCPSHAYLGTLTLSGDDPSRLTISSRDPNGGANCKPYIEVDVTFTLQTGSIANIWPGFLIARAAAIVLVRRLSGKIPQDCVERLPGALA